MYLPTRATTPLIIVVAALYLAGPAGAAEDRFRIAIGMFVATNANGTLRVDDSTAPITLGSALVWDRDLGGETNVTTPRIEGYWRFAEKHRVDFGYFDLARSGGITTAHDLTVGDTLFPAGTLINAEWDSTVVKLAYSYSLFRAPEIEVAVSAGFHSTKTAFSMSAPTAVIAKSADFTAPLPVIGLRLDYTLSGRWHARLNNDLFFLDSLGGVSGSLTDFSLQLEHRTFESIGFGAALNRTSQQYSKTEGTTTSASDSQVNGFTFYVTMGF